jgi:hypothetical protein
VASCHYLQLQLLVLELVYSRSSYGQFWVNSLSYFLILAAFISVLAGVLVAYERPNKNKKKMTGRGGDFES